MKQKKIFILAAAALAFAACSSDESPTAPEEQETGAAYTQGEVPVAFDAYVTRGLTRAGKKGSLTTTELQNASVGFGVFGYYTDNQLYSESATPNFMYNQKVSYDETATKWTYAPVKYWPNEYGNLSQSAGVDRLSFFAYAPYVSVDPVTGLISGDSKSGIMALTRNTKMGNPMVKYYVDLKPANRVDLCWGVAKAAYTSVVEGTADFTVNGGDPYVDVTKPTTASLINFDFKHALAWLNIQIDADVDKETHGGGIAVGTEGDGTVDDATKIYVRSVTFEGFTTKGLLDLNAKSSEGPLWYDLTGSNRIGGSSITVYDGRRDNKEGQVGATASNEVPADLNSAIIQTEAGTEDGVTKTAVNLFSSPSATMPVFVIPTGEPLKVTIAYDVETADPSLPGFLSDGKTKGSVVSNVITKAITWNTGTNPNPMEAGYKYQVNLHLGMTSVKFDASVTVWSTTTEEGYSWLPINEDD